MQEERMKCILSGLKKFELTEAETKFIFFVEQNLNQKGLLIEKVESVLESIYRQKTSFIRESIFTMIDQGKNISSGL